MKETATPKEVLNRHLELSRSNPEEDFLECYREERRILDQEIERNAGRDWEQSRKLIAGGWLVLRVWESHVHSR